MQNEIKTENAPLGQNDQALATPATGSTPGGDTNGRLPAASCSAGNREFVLRTPEQKWERTFKVFGRDFLERYPDLHYNEHMVDAYREDLTECLKLYGADSDKYRKLSEKVGRELSKNLLPILDFLGRAFRVHANEASSHHEVLQTEKDVLNQSDLFAT